MVVLGVLLARRGTSGGRALAYGALVVALVPLLLRAIEGPARYAWKHVWFKIGQEGIALDHGDAWKVLGLPDTSLSWYGAAGAVVILGGVVAAVVGARRRQLRRGAVVLAVAPLLLIVTFAFTIVYDPWRGRLVMFAVGLACAAWGWTIRVRWLSAGVAALCVTTVALSLVHSYTKPAGFGLLEPSISRSVWHRDRIDTLTVIRNYDGTPVAPAEGGGRRPGRRRARRRDPDRHLPRPARRPTPLAHAPARPGRRPGPAGRDVARVERPVRRRRLPGGVVGRLHGRRVPLAPAPPHGRGRVRGVRDAALSRRSAAQEVAALEEPDGTTPPTAVAADVLRGDRLVLRQVTRRAGGRAGRRGDRAAGLRRPATSRRGRPRRGRGPPGSARAATSFFPIFSSGLDSLGSGRLTPSPIAIGTRCRSRTSFRMPSGISENAWSVPFAAWLAVKCFSITRAPSM